MLLTLWRHGEAGYAASDAERALTDRGEAHVRSSAAAYLSWCRNTDVQVPSHCIHSPLVRTRQTSQLLGADMGFATLASDDRLAPGEQHYIQAYSLLMMWIINSS